MEHFDDLKQFLRSCEVQPKEITPRNGDEYLLIEDTVNELCATNYFPEREYRRLLRGHYRDNKALFIQRVCEQLDITPHVTQIMLKHCVYTIKRFHKTPDAAMTRAFETNGINSPKELALRAYANTVNITLKTQRNIIVDLDSNVTEVRQEAAKLAVRIIGQKMATQLPEKDQDDDDQETIVNDSNDQTMPAITQAAQDSDISDFEE